MNKLSKKQKKFIDAKAMGLNGTDAAKLAGYAVPKQEAARLMTFPQVREALWQEREILINRSLAPKALACLEGILDDPNVKADAKVRAAVWLMEAAGHGIEAQKVKLRWQPGGEKRLCDLTEEELEEVVRRGRAEISVMEAEIVDSQRVTDTIVPQS